MSSSAETAGRRRIAGERRRPTTPAPSGRVPRTRPEEGVRRPARPLALVPAVGAGQAPALARRRPHLPRWSGWVALALAAALLAGIAGTLLRGPSVGLDDERAAVATARTSLERILSFDARTVDAQPGQVAGLLTGSFRDEFARTMKANVAPLAVRNGAVVKAQVREIGVASTGADRVTVQAFVNQTRTTTADPSPAIDQNRVLATLTRVDGRWLVSGLQAY